MNGAVRPRVWVLVVLLGATHLLLHVGFSYGRGAPDLLTLALLLASWEIGLGRAAGLGLFFGLLEDALSVLSFGANTVTMTVLGCAGAAARSYFLVESRKSLVWYLLGGKLTRDLVHWVAVGWVEGDAGLRQPFVEQVVIEGGIASVYVAVLGVVLATVFQVGADE